MKVALQLSGRLRFTRDSLSSIFNNIINIYSPDIFCSFWEPEGADTKSVWEQYVKSVKIEYERQDQLTQTFETLFNYNLHKNMPSMSYKFFKVNKLRKDFEAETGTKYDVVIQARSDNLFFEQLKIPTITKGIWCSNRTASNDIDPYVHPRMVDNFYLGDPESIDTAAQTFFNIKPQADAYLTEGKLHHIRIPEIIQTKIWTDLGIQIHSLDGGNPAGDFWYEIDRRYENWS